MQKVLITGGAGYLGSVLCEFLLEKGYQVTALDNLSYKQISLLHLCSNKNLSFDKNLKGDFDLINHTLSKKDNKFIYIGCQILNKSLFKNYKLSNFSISKIWGELLNTNQLNGFESLNEFYHLTDLETFKKLQDL